MTSVRLRNGRACLSCGVLYRILRGQACKVNRIVPKGNKGCCLCLRPRNRPVQFALSNKESMNFCLLFISQP
ncbi:hypothetical protein BDV24DRAFT_136429 [Aspergillus arachidicola]|uniref:Uncharacterized protein n=1 Tax=Aspergillus arachidicola TaxID=656916 RepID=A0A5N6Y175_9EURO|nr:hypothetical protein BDV24DRAFT_136429 [Aspergillus arachidicola]